MKFFLFSILLIQSSYAADCVIGDGDTAITVKEAEQSSLFESGKNLSTFRVQDQDGLGTCYANATSAVLKSVLPNQPDVSYTHAALEANTRGVDPNWTSNKQRFIRRDGKDISDITYGGFTCRTVDALKNTGGACPASQSILENRTLQDSNVQQRLMENMGSYFDDMNAIQTNPNEAKSYRDHLALVVESLNTERARLIQSCVEEKNSDTPLSHGLRRMIGTEIINLKKKPCENEIRTAIQALFPESNISSDRNRLTIPNELKARLQQAIDANPSLKALLTRSAAGASLTPAENLRIMDNFGTLLSDFLKASISSPEITTCLSGSYIPTTDPVELGTTFASNMRMQKGMNCETEISNESVFAAIKSAESNQCIPPARLEVILNAIAPLLEVGSAIDARMMTTLSNPLTAYGNQLKQLIAPACQDKANLINMDNVSCRSYSTCQESDLGSVYNGPVNGCTTLAEAKKVLGRQIINGIKQGRALGIDVCTAFMEDPTVVSNFCKNAPPGVPGHSYHAMAISGYRCVAGKMEYEVLNSWGKESCPISSAPYKNSAIECVLDSDGRPTGKWWAKEDVLIDNTTRINDVTNGAP